MASLGLPFSDAVRVDNMLYLSGVVGMVPGKMELVPGGLEAEAKQVMENIKTVLEASGSSMENVVKVTVFIDDISLWSDFNKVYVEYFPGKKPARSALGAEGLALGAAVEVECIAVIPE
ncbi:MAG: RidA family protein [Cytophagia bacterium]|nr:RidA family protein [Cytophagia bacterium]